MDNQPNNQNNTTNNSNVNNQSNQNQGGQQQNNQNRNVPNTPVPPKAIQTPPPQDRNRKFLQVAGIIVAIIVIATVVGNGKWGKKATPSTNTVSTTADQLPEGCTPGGLFNTTTGKPCPQPIDINQNTAPTTTTTPSPVSLGYEDAVRTYAGKVVLFDASCKTTPIAPTFTAGTRIVVANNSDTPRTIAVADESKTLTGYHYYMVTLKTAGEVVASCNGKPAVTITVK